MALNSNIKGLSGLNITPIQPKYKGEVFPAPPSPKFIFDISGGLMAAQTLLIDEVQASEFLTLANGFTEPDSPDGRSGDPQNNLSDKTLPGQPVYGKIILGNEDGNNQWTDAQQNTGSYRTVELDCAICAIEFNNQVVKTDIQGLPFSVKEFMSGGDSNITITGIYNSTPGVAPMDFIINLNNIFSAPVPIPVQNYYLNANNIYWIVVMPGTELAQEQAGYAYQKFTIRALSDVPAEHMLP